MGVCRLSLDDGGENFRLGRLGRFVFCCLWSAWSGIGGDGTTDGKPIEPMKSSDRCPVGLLAVNDSIRCRVLVRKELGELSESISFCFFDKDRLFLLLSFNPDGCSGFPIGSASSLAGGRGCGA